MNNHRQEDSYQDRLAEALSDRLVSKFDSDEVGKNTEGTDALKKDHLGWDPTILENVLDESRLKESKKTISLSSNHLASPRKYYILDEVNRRLGLSLWTYYNQTTNANKSLIANHAIDFYLDLVDIINPESPSSEEEKQSKLLKRLNMEVEKIESKELELC